MKKRVLIEAEISFKKKKQCIQKDVIDLFTSFEPRMEGNVHNKANSICLFFTIELKSYLFLFQNDSYLYHR